MSDRFGFDQVARKMVLVNRRFLQRGVVLAQNEMNENFSTQTSKETGRIWPPLTYLINGVVKPPPRLILSNQLRIEAINGKPLISGNFAVLTIDPIDSRGKGYASYHQDGENQYKTKDQFQSEFVTQSTVLDSQQRNMLIEELDKVFL